MARVPGVDIEAIPKELKSIYKKYSTDYGPFENQVKIFAQRPPALKHIMGLLLELDQESVLPKKYLEIAIVVVSRLNECEYCVAHHTPRLIAHGLSEETADRILESNCPGFDEVDLLVRDFAIQVTQKPGRIPEKVFDSLRQHFSDEQIVELVLRIALCGFFNRFNDALKIEIE